MIFLLEQEIKDPNSVFWQADCSGFRCEAGATSGARAETGRKFATLQSRHFKNEADYETIKQIHSNITRITVNSAKLPGIMFLFKQSSRKYEINQFPLTRKWKLCSTFSIVLSPVVKLNDLLEKLFLKHLRWYLISAYFTALGSAL